MNLVKLNHLASLCLGLSQISNVYYGDAKHVPLFMMDGWTFMYIAGAS